jgi:hypothetical protein
VLRRHHNKEIDQLVAALNPTNWRTLTQLDGRLAQARFMPCSSKCADDRNSEEASTRESASKLSEVMEVLRTLPALAGGEERCS